MRRMIFEGPRRARWHDAADALLPSAVGAIVEPIAVATCDVDVLLMRGKATFLGEGFPMGHEAVARIVEVGEDVHERKPGDTVVIPFQLSCGTCARCTYGQTGHCEDLPGNPMFGLGWMGGNRDGTLADRIAVPFADHMLVPVPSGIDPTVVAGASDNLPDAYRCVTVGLAHAPGADVLVVGGRAASIGLYSISIALALGATTVSYTDRDQDRLLLAESLGAVPMAWPDSSGLPRHRVTIDASGHRKGLTLALRSTDHDGVCILAAMPFGEASLPLFDMYSDGVTFVTARNSSRHYIPAVLDLVASGAIDPRPVTNATVTWEEAEGALEDPPDKLVILGPASR